MGERVVINPAAAKEQTAAVPLEYGHGGKRQDAWRRFASTVGTFTSDGVRRVRDRLREDSATLEPELRRLLKRLGGWQQLGFAAGLGFILGGIGFSLGSPQAVLMMWLGGVLVGLCLRLPR